MSLLLSRRLLRLSLGKPAGSVRSSLLLILSNGFSSSLQETLPCEIKGACPCGDGLGNLVAFNRIHNGKFIVLEKKVPMELVSTDEIITVGSSHGWVATLKEDGILRLQDDLNPNVASDIDPKRIPLPPLVTLPRCQTKIVTNMAMSSPSPEDEDCIVAIKFLGHQLSFCRPAQSNSEWTNIKIENLCFSSSRVMYSKKDDMFRILGSGGHLIGSWDPRKDKNKPKFQKLRFVNFPELTKTKQELLHSCCTSDHLVESRPTDETFLVKWYRKTCSTDMAKMRTEALMVFKLDAKGNAVYTSDIGDLHMFLSRSEPFCVLDPDNYTNRISIRDFDEIEDFSLDGFVFRDNHKFGAPYYIPPQN